MAQLQEQFALVEIITTLFSVGILAFVGPVTPLNCLHHQTRLLPLIPARTLQKLPPHPAHHPHHHPYHNGQIQLMLFCERGLLSWRVREAGGGEKGGTSVRARQRACILDVHLTAYIFRVPHRQAADGPSRPQETKST